MSKFWNRTTAALSPYVPGEQPKERKYNKLNTNESPFPPSKKAIEAAEEAARNLELYSDPEAKKLTEALSGCKNITLAENTVTIVSALNDQSREKLAALAAELWP